MHTSDPRVPGVYEASPRKADTCRSSTSIKTREVFLDEWRLISFASNFSSWSARVSEP